MPNPLKSAKEVFEKYLKLADSDKMVVDYTLAVAASNFLPDKGDPVWGLVIGPPGSVKTEMLRAFDGHDMTYMLDTLTPQSLISGYERDDGKPVDLLPQLDGKIFVLKELTSLLGLPQAVVAQVTGDLRSIYDGMHSKAFGTVGTKYMKSRFAMMAAVTPIIDRQTLINVDLGERFISLRVSKRASAPQSRVDLAKHVLDGMGGKAEWRVKLSRLVWDAIDYCKDSPKRIDFSPEDANVIANLADLVALCRTTPDEEGNPVSPEQPTRTVQQLARLAMGHALVSGRSSLNEEDLELVRRVAFDTLPDSVGRLVSHLVERYGSISYHEPTTSIVAYTHLSPKWVAPMLRQYESVGLVGRKSDGPTPLIRLTDDAAKKIKECGFV